MEFCRFLFLVLANSYGITREQIDAISEKIGRGEALTDAENRIRALMLSESNTKMAEMLLGNERFINKLVHRNASLAAKVIDKIKALTETLSRVGDEDAMAEHRRLKKAENLYLKAAKAAGNRALIEKIRGGDDKEDNELTNINDENMHVSEEPQFNRDVIDLSHDNKLAALVQGIYGSKKYNIIREYILKELENQPIVLSDGKKAVVDNSDAQHIARGAGDKKTSEISRIKSIVENAELFAEEESTKDGKFDYFWYYRAFVVYDNETIPVYVNVGRAKNDSSYHIYDITQKIRDTAHRVYDVGRPVGNAILNGISNNMIPDSTGIVNTSDEKIQFSHSDNDIDPANREGSGINAREFERLRKRYENLRTYGKSDAGVMINMILSDILPESEDCFFSN